MRELKIWVSLIILVIVILLILSINSLFNHVKGNIITINNHQVVYLDDYDMRIRLNSIEDSRCPKDVTCIWSGELTYNLTISYKNNKDKYILSTVKNPSIKIDKYTINIDSYTDKSITIKINS